MKSIVRRSAIAIAVALGSSLALSAPALAASSPTATSPAQWQSRVTQLPTLPAGCYQASYPQLAWHASACSTAPAVTFAPTGAPGAAATGTPGTVGDGHDYSSVVTGKISKAVGTFTNVSTGIKEHGLNYITGTETPNTFSLQLNSQFFSGSPACTGSVGGKCLAWEQFVYSTVGNELFIQYWLIDYNAKCPAGWYTYANDCYTNSQGSHVQSGPVTAAKLASVELSASAVAGGNDENAVVVGAKRASLIVTPDSKVDLAKFWNTAEWNVFGDGDGSQAIFGAGTTLEPETTLTSTGTLSCASEGFTGETNNLTRTATPALAPTASPTMAFRETNAHPSGVTCATSQG